MKSNIVLCGFMGSGKTVTGKLVADILKMDFIDLDKYIETAQGMTVSQIFNLYGETYFRTLETNAAKKLSLKRNTVIALGGGTVLKEENLSYLKSSGIIFLLDVSPETVMKRLKNDTSRPLLENNKASSVLSLMEQRTPIYKKSADYIINSNLSKEFAAENIIKIFNMQKLNIH